MDGNVVIHAYCKQTNEVGTLSDLCFLCASVFQILLLSNEGYLKALRNAILTASIYARICWITSPRLIGIGRPSVSWISV